MASEPGPPLGRLASAGTAALLAGFSILVLLPGSWSPSQVTRGDVYTFVLRVAVGMIEKGSWLVPHLGDSVDFSKPPLFHWAIALLLKAIPNPFLAARLPAVLCAAGTVMWTYALGRLLGLAPSRSALAGLLWLSSAAMASYGRQPLLESPLAVCMLGAFYGLVRACLQRDPRWLYLFGALLGASSMVKWVVGPLSVGLFAAAFLAWTGAWRWVLERRGHACLALLLAAGIALPWPAYIASTHWRGFLTQMHRELFLDRFSVPTSFSEFLVRGIVLGFLPWTFLLAPAVRDARRLTRDQRAALGAWLLSGLLPTLLVASRTSRYAFPALPALALAVSALLDDKDRAWKAALRATGALASLALGAALLAFGRVGALPVWLLVPGLAAALGVGAFALRGRSILASACAGLGVMLLTGPGTVRAGFNVVPREATEAIGERPYGRYLNDPQSASTGLLPLYLGRGGYVFGERDFTWALDADALIVVSGTGLERFLAECARQKASFRILAHWRAPHTNPPADLLRAALRERSLDPIQVDHWVVELLPRKTSSL